MPGKNHGEMRNDGDCMDIAVLPLTYYVTILFVIAIELVGLTRFYYIQNDSWKYSNACYLETLFFIMADIPLFWSLTKVKIEDPGYVLLPSSGATYSTADSSIEEEICQKCGVMRKNELTHHCSRCGRCTDNMDHHCMVADNCIGRGNLRYFI